MLCLRPSRCALDTAMKLYKTVRLKNYASSLNLNINITDWQKSNSQLKHSKLFFHNSKILLDSSSSSFFAQYFFKRDYSFLGNKINKSFYCSLIHNQSWSTRCFQHHYFHRFSNPDLCEAGKEKNQSPASKHDTNKADIKEMEEVNDIAKQYIKDKDVKEKMSMANSSSTVSEQAKEKPSIFQRFKKTYKEHGKVAVAVFTVMSVFWYGSAYAVAVVAAYYGFDLNSYILAILEYFNFSEGVTKPFKSKNVGALAVAIIMIKILAPLKYGSIFYAIHRTVRYLQKTGRIQQVAKEDTLRSLASESTVIMKRRYKKSNISGDVKHRLNKARSNFNKGMTSAKSNVNTRMSKARTRFNTTKTNIQRKRTKSDR